MTSMMLRLVFSPWRGVTAEGLDQYVHERRRVSTLVAHFGFVALMVIEDEILNDFLRFIGALIAEFAAGGAVNLALKMKGDMIIKI
ncbi:hypothetical protein Tco_0009967 [Tanacetum coccineum]